MSYRFLRRPVHVWKCHKRHKCHTRHARAKFSIDAVRHFLSDVAERYKALFDTPSHALSYIMSDICPTKLIESVWQPLGIGKSQARYAAAGRWTRRYYQSGMRR